MIRVLLNDGTYAMVSEKALREPVTDGARRFQQGEREDRVHEEELKRREIKRQTRREWM